MDYYTKDGLTCYDVLCAVLSPEELAGFCKGNVIKYLWREKQKGGIEDLRKAVWYLEKLVELRQKSVDKPPDR